MTRSGKRDLKFSLAITMAIKHSTLIYTVHGQVLYVHDFHKQYDYTIVFCLFSQSVPWGWTAANMLVLKRAREALGFQQCKVFAVGAAPIKMETMEYFMSVNIPIMNVYGKETSCSCLE